MKLKFYQENAVGPYWKNRTQNVWNIPKGHVENSENLLDCAIREFEEETGLIIPTDKYLNFQYLGFTKTSQNKKIVHIYALEHDFIPIEGEYKVQIKSNLCEVEYPPKSGKIILIPELDEAKYININIANAYIFKYQQIFLDRLNCKNFV